MELNPVILHEDGSGLTIADALIMLKVMRIRYGNESDVRTLRRTPHAAGPGREVHRPGRHAAGEGGARARDVRPEILPDRRRGSNPARQMPRTRPVGPRRAGGVRRRQPAHRRADRRVRGTGPHLRPLHLPARQPEPAHADGGLQSGTAQEIPGTLRTRRGAVRDRHLRARRRRRSRRHDHARGARTATTG